MPPHPSLDDARAHAALYALGALPPAEARAFEAHLDDCDTCAAELAAFAGVAGDLGHAATPQTPDPGVRLRVLERIAAEATGADTAAIDGDGVHFVRSARLGWQDAAAPNVETKTLFVDPARGYITKLVRMAPGAVLLPHRHADVEESYVIEGDLLVSGVLMHAGDYCRADPGSVHAGVTTRGGCTFIAVCSQRDAVLAE